MNSAPAELLHPLTHAALQPSMTTGLRYKLNISHLMQAVAGLMLLKENLLSGS